MKINFFFYLIVIVFASCKVYKQDIMFRLDDNFTADDLSKITTSATRNYIICKNDRLSLYVFTNKGERIIDPNNELALNVQADQSKDELSFLVMSDGTVKLPIVGIAELEGMTLNAAEILLEQMYNEFYKDAFVKLEFKNKRVYLLGAYGNKVIPMTNDQMNIVEVLAMNNGSAIEGFDAMSNNIRVIRGDLNDPEVFHIDLSTIAGMKKSMMLIEPGDVVYVEPIRRPFVDGTKDVLPFFSILSSTAAIILVLQNSFR